jgi:hypothetical protein
MGTSLEQSNSHTGLACWLEVSLHPVNSIEVLRDLPWSQGNCSVDTQMNIKITFYSIIVHLHPVAHCYITYPFTFPLRLLCGLSMF